MILMRTAAATRPAEQTIRDGEHHGVLLDEVKGFKIIDCKPCGFRHVLPLPQPEALKEAYADAYYRDEKPTYIARAKEDAEWSKLAWNDRLTLFEELLQGEAKPLHVLDIGCGPGWFLSAARERGWQTRGIEPSKQAAAHAQSLGLNVADVMFDAAVASCLQPAHVVHLNNMLEHVANPIELLKNAISVTRPGGIVCVGVPNDYNGFQEAVRRNGEDPWWIVPPHHLNYLSFASLEELLERLGLHVVDTMTSFPMELFLLMGENYVGNDVVGREVHSKRKRFDLTLEKVGMGETRRKFYRALSNAGLGREAIVIARKPK
jgi:SAM-dependent methyltransferase